MRQAKERREDLKGYNCERSKVIRSENLRLCSVKNT